MAKLVLALVSDLIFAAGIEATMRRAGFRAAVVEEVEALRAALAAEETAAVILDLHAGATADEVVACCRPLGVPVVAFGRHTEAAILRGARAAGCAAVVPRSTFVAEMTALVEGAIAGQEPAPPD